MLVESEKKIEPYIERSGLLTFKTLSEKLHQDGLEVTDIDLFRFRLLPQVKIARKAYSTEEMAKWTIETTEGKIPAFFENFRLTPAKHSLSKSDYEIVHRSAQLKEFIIEVNGRHHILLDDIPQITSLLHPPSEEYLSLTDLAKTLPRTQKRKLQRAFQTGEIDGIKRRKEWMTTQEIFDEYLEKHSSNSKV